MEVLTKIINVPPGATCISPRRMTKSFTYKKIFPMFCGLGKFVDRYASLFLVNLDEPISYG